MRCAARAFLIASTILLAFAQPVRAAEGPRVTPVVRAVRSVAPAVVNITSEQVVERETNPFHGLFRDEALPPFFEEFFGGSRKRRYTRESLGSGVIIDGGQSLVLTNAHVISGASSISARLLDGREFEAELVGSDPDFDLAVLKLAEARNLPAVSMGDSGDIMIGETVIAIGNPYGFSHTVTTGVVSATGRSIRTRHGAYTDFIQTDAAINPGNSGGPLLNIKGELVGLNTAIQAGAEGIGFAIPINKARRVVDELLDRGYVAHVWLGLTGQNLDRSVAGYFNLDKTDGMLVTEVYDGGAAKKAGLRASDVVLGVDGVSVQDKEHYLDLLRNFTRGQTITLTVFREGRKAKVKVRPDAFTEQTARNLAWLRWGLELDRDPAGAALRVAQVRRGGPAAELGLQPGDKVVRIAGMRVNEYGDFVRAFQRYRMNGRVLMLVDRGGRGYYVKLRI
jgi:Do/DeqQ family serine protease